MDVPESDIALDDSFQDAIVDDADLAGMDVVAETEEIIAGTEEIVNFTEEIVGFAEEIGDASEEVVDSNATEESTNSVQKSRTAKSRICELPLSKIKGIMKMDPEVGMVGSEAVFAVAKATELFLHALSKQSVHYTLAQKKKTIQRTHVDSAVQNSNCLYFLEDALD
ncbi:unnamed protein product [Nesidiocoris tenuis]|uniref:Transcription factor CBF/NF-Y/archaeal histone domain-containing protein n=1 Tax=Nesidiocoris tenuis TaxID=355587 RepID=A0A6H5FXE0_9HEMI|nr:unnamed protein product [Nesidiocoris tenuis]